MKIVSTIALGLLLPLGTWAQEGVESPNQCQMPRPLPILICEAGGDFLCVNTPPGGTKENFAVIQGRLNLTSSTLGSFSVSTQHEYTNEIQNIELVEPIETDCWEQSLSAAQNFCLEADGKFAVWVPLPQLGPYTIAVSASRPEGASMQKVVRTSSVIPITMTPDIVTFDPEIAGGALSADTTHLRVTLDLLKNCEPRETCDFFGTTTGGVWVTIENQIASEPPIQVRCATNVTQGGAGLFVIGVPVLPGQNQLRLSICDPHTGFAPENCPKIELPLFAVGGEPAAIEILSLGSNGSLQFKVRGFHPEGCDETVQVAWNLQSPQPLCADSEGNYHVQPQPKPGYNVISIEANLPNQRLEETISFAHGKILTPFDQSGVVLPEEAWRLRNALQGALSKDLFNETLLPPLETYLRSADFKTGLKNWTEELGRSERERSEDPLAATKERIQNQLGFCPKSGPMADLRVKVMREPVIGELTLQPIRFSDQKLSWNLQAKDVELALQLYQDANDDGRPDIDPLPLKVAFQEVTMEPGFEVAAMEGMPFLLKLTSPSTDCDYKRSGACYHLPALFTPRKFTGAANPAGAFVTCDHSQGVSGEMEEICHALNVVDRQTGGVIQEKILDVLNKTFACDGTAALTVKVQEGIPIQFANSLLEVTGKIGLESLKITEAGLSFALFSQFGDQEDFSNWPRALRKPQTGILVGSDITTLPAASEEGLSLNIALPVVSQIFWEGLSFTIDEAFFLERDFNFTTECDATLHTEEEGWELPALCHIRPRAQEILGSEITNYGYLSPESPLQLTLVPSLAFPLHLDVLEAGQKLGLELADWELNIASAEASLITARISMLLVVEVSPLQMPVSDLDHFILQLKVVPGETKLWVVPKAQSNTTVIPASILLANLKEKLQLALDSYAQEGNEISIPIPRSFDFAPDSLFGRLGLSELTLGPEGLGLAWDATQDRLQLNLHPILQ